MCEFSGRLIVWLDNELPADAAAEVDRHVQGCAECAGSLARYRHVSRTFETYCDAALAAQAQRKAPPWVPVLAGAAAAGVAIALVLVAFPRGDAVHTGAPAPASAAPVIAAETAPTTVTIPQAAPAAVHGDVGRVPKRIHQQAQLVPPRVLASHASQLQYANWARPERSIRIAIPVDAVLPPGAAPEGTAFVADVSFGADGSPQTLVLQPELVSLERRTNQP